MRLFQAIRLFFRVLSDSEFATTIDTGPQEPPQLENKEIPTTTPPRPARSDAIGLLAVLQREARFIDLVQEPLESYSDAQIGAAARDILGDAAKVLERIFAIHPLVNEKEGDSISIPTDYDTGIYHLQGNVSPDSAEGRLVHPGWKATRCELPTWSGSEQASLVVAPAEVEIGT